MTIGSDGQAEILGSALALFAFDIGFQIDLDAAESLVTDATRQRIVRSRRPSPGWFDYSPPPLRLALDGARLTVGDAQTESIAEVLVYDFGAALLTYRLPLPDTIDALPQLGVSLFDHDGLLADARERAARVLESLRPAVERPRLADAFEDYVVFSITAWGDARPADVLQRSIDRFAQAVEGESVELSAQQVGRLADGAMSYANSDLAAVDWNAAVLLDAEPDDVISVLQHANIELLELRVLDQELDSILDHADRTLAALTRSRVWPTFASGGMLRRFASVQTDAAVMFEGVNNAIKLLGNQYLARVYRLTATRLDLPSWQASVQRKLEATDNLYSKMSDSTATRRLEVLEWVIIVLIAISIALPFTPWYH